MTAQDIQPPRPGVPTSGASAAGASARGGELDARGSAAAPAEAENDPRVADLVQQVAELEDRWRRALADLDNLRKRYERESAQQRARERAQVAAAWLPVLDHLELALAHATANPSSIIEGVRGVRDQALEVLAGLGFPRREDEGTAFDPVQHEAVAAVPAAHVPPGTVLEVVRPGYGEGERQLRPAAVVVATVPEEPGGGSGELRGSEAR